MHKILSILLVAISIVGCNCQSNCSLQGDWIITSGRLSKNYEMASPYSANRIVFSSDSVELASGFFYQTDDLIDNYPVGRYPFVYYGNKEKYKILNDSLFIYSNPYGLWHSFKIESQSNGKVILLGEIDTLSLERTRHFDTPNSCQIEYIKAHCYGVGGDIDLFKINYKVMFLKDDKLLFEDLSPQNDYKKTMFTLKSGTFNKLCDGFKNINIPSLKPVYETRISEINVVQLEIGFIGGKVYRSELQNDDYPDELRLALVPVLYMHQHFLYGNLPPVK
jgi:hypothetical protein